MPAQRTGVPAGFLRASGGRTPGGRLTLRLCLCHRLAPPQEGKIGRPRPERHKDGVDALAHHGIKALKKVESMSVLGSVSCLVLGAFDPRAVL